MSVENTLAERGARYGSFMEHSRIAQSLQDVMRSNTNWEFLESDERQALTTIADKIARILNAPAGTIYSDSFHDIAGYALLVDKRLKALEAEKMVGG
jgi:nucleoid-associated protein YejK